MLKATRLHSEAKFTIEGIEVDRVKAVAHVALVDDVYNNFNWVYYLEDGSQGRIEARRWVDKDHLNQDVKDRMLDEIPPHCYVRVVGTLKQFNKVNHMEITSIQRVDDMHEPFFHLLEAAFATLHYERGPPRAINLFSRSSRSATGIEVTNVVDADLSGNLDIGADTKVANLLEQPSMTKHEPSTQSGWQPTAPQQFHHEAHPSAINSLYTDSHPQATTSVEEDESQIIDLSSGSDDSDYLSIPPESPSPSPSPEPPSPTRNVQPFRRRDPYSHLTILQRGILLQIHANKADHPEGVPVALIVKGLARPNRSVEDFANAIETLLDEGLIYSKADDNHLLVVE
ncbi:hypothetical protein EW146_g717 [Bondarzewia mesenterica]|uniref:Replication protein A C-terminal domain-containing protein n=1 Tax=Bondarzewia mesenterica TaxID=1095465 RepID=A0A4S4M7F9_9AGAM|nr:hypothetical protein EW146_g717 [Bondarzewia mesenterica]